MKKIFYILASAIVALGAVACENEGMENIAPEVNGDTVSFVANIDNTKTDLDGLQTVWTAGDEITVVWNEKEYTFTNSDKNVNEFSCTADGLSAIVGQPVEAWYNKNGVDSSAGTAGAQLYATGSFGELSFQIQSAFLKFTTTEEVVLAGEGLFNNAKATYTGTDVYVAINAVESTLSYSVNGIECKSLTKNFEAGKIYNLGTLTAPAAIWMLGDWDGWANPLRMYVEGDYYVARNVKIAADQGFKFNDGTKYLGGASTANAWNNFNGSDIKLAAGTYDIYISKTNGAWCAVTAGNAAPALNKRYLYLNPSNNWKEASAKFVAWCYGGTASDANKQFTWAMYENSKDYYYLDITGYKQFYIKRLDPNAGIGDGAWNEVGPVTIGNNSLITISGWDSYSAGSLVP